MSKWPAGYERVILTETDSTMAEAARRAPKTNAPTWILAEHQTAAKGRRGRAWVHPKGNFAATLLLRPTEPPEIIALRSFVAALALADAFDVLTGQPEAFSLKWPNDVLLNGAKVAGILLEASGQRPSTRYLSIGIGINLASAPVADELEARAVAPVALSSLGARIEPTECLDALAVAYAHRETQFTTYGFEPIRAAWLARAARLGEEITARTGATERTGLFETVDNDGNLVLTTDNHRHAIPAADVFF